MSENETKTDEKTEKKKPAPKATADRIPVGVIRFEQAYDFKNGAQSQGLTCVAELGVHTTYVCTYILSLGMFELITGNNHQPVDEMLIPRERVKFWKRLDA